MTLKIALTENRTKASKNNKYEKLTTGTAKERHKPKKIILALFRLYTDSTKPTITFHLLEDSSNTNSKTP